ncbi:unnamed protein product [Peniophora sp. CBMAI 1063]|nr:unnamed protein product [Peniophora sp. CBMAI 1063]
METGYTCEKPGRKLLVSLTRLGRVASGEPIVHAEEYSTLYGDTAGISYGDDQALSDTYVLALVQNKKDEPPRHERNCSVHGLLGLLMHSDFKHGPNIRYGWTTSGYAKV